MQVEWVKCSDRMPDVWKTVLIFGHHGFEGRKRLDDYFVGFLGTTGLWHPVCITGENIDLDLYGAPTHWMLLPEPPESK